MVAGVSPNMQEIAVIQNVGMETESKEALVEHAAGQRPDEAPANDPVDAYLSRATEEGELTTQKMRSFIADEQRKDHKLIPIIKKIEEEKLEELRMKSKSTQPHIYRLVGDDRLLKPHKGAMPVTSWPLIASRSLIPTVLSLFHGDRAILGHTGTHKAIWAIKKRFLWQ